jgi:hypothetical protein
MQQEAVGGKMERPTGVKCSHRRLIADSPTRPFSGGTRPNQGFSCNKNKEGKDTSYFNFFTKKRLYFYIQPFL